MQSNNFVKICLGAAALLLIPFVAMQLTDEMSWSLSDYAIVWALLVGIGCGGLLAFKGTNASHLRLLGGLIIVALLWLWAELAVGVFTNWGS